MISHGRVQVDEHGKDTGNHLLRIRVGRITDFPLTKPIYI